MKTIDEPEIDSCSVSIPIEKVEIVDPNLLSSRVAVFEDTGQIDENYKLKERSLSLKLGPGIKSTVSINSRYNRTTGTRDFVVFGINSKMLRQKYFDGITDNNIHDIYDLLMSQGVVKFPFEYLKTDATVTDVDIKWDGVYKGEPIHLLKAIRESAAYTQNRGEGVRPFFEKDNLGIEFSVRQTTAYSRAPYFKIYHKGVEMTGRTAEFTGAFIDTDKLKDLWRVETTVKNKAHFQRHGIQDNILGNVLSMSTGKKKSILKAHFQAHIQGGIKRIVPQRESLGPTDKVLLHFVRQCMIAGDSLDVIIEKAIRSIDGDKVARSRMKSRLYSICSGGRVMSVNGSALDVAGGVDVTGAKDFCKAFGLVA